MRPLKPGTTRVAVSCDSDERTLIAFDAWVAAAPGLKELAIKDNESVQLTHFQKGMSSLCKLQKLYLDCILPIYAGKQEEDASQVLDLRLNRLTTVGLYVDRFNCSKLLLPNSVTTLYAENSSPQVNFADLRNLKRVLLPNMTSGDEWSALPWSQLEYVAFSAGPWNFDYNSWNSRSLEDALKRLGPPLACNGIPLKVRVLMESEMYVKTVKIPEMRYIRDILTFLGQRVTDLEIWTDRRSAIGFAVACRKLCPFATIRTVEGDHEEFLEAVKAEMDPFFLSV